MRAFFVLIAMTMAVPAFGLDHHWFTMNQNQKNPLRFLKCETEDTSPAEMYGYFKADGYEPTIKDLADGGVELSYRKGASTFTVVYYRDPAACEAAATAARSAAEAEKRKLDPYR